MKETRNTQIIWGICILIGIIIGVRTAVTNTGNIVLPIVILIFIICFLCLIFVVQKTYSELLFLEKKLETQKKKRWDIYFLEINQEEREELIKAYDENISNLKEVIEMYIKLLLKDRYFMTKKQREHINEISQK